MAKQILILNGPNLNLLGTRETHIYGKDTLGAIQKRCEKKAKSLSLGVDFRQSNHEGELVTWIQEGAKSKDIYGLILNAAAYSHTSIAILDALKMLGKPIVEVHLSNLFTREPFRHHSYVTPLAKGIICGFGAKGYELAIEAISELI